MNALCISNLTFGFLVWRCRHQIQNRIPSDQQCDGNSKCCLVPNLNWVQLEVIESSRKYLIFIPTFLSDWIFRVIFTRHQIPIHATTTKKVKTYIANNLIWFKWCSRIYSLVIPSDNTLNMARNLIIIIIINGVNCADSAFFKWSPSGHQVVTKWSPNGYQVVTK